MYDIKQINRVRGILSARYGTQIPKFQNPAGTIDDPNSPQALGAKDRWDYIDKRRANLAKLGSADEQLAELNKIFEDAKKYYPQDSDSNYQAISSTGQWNAPTNKAQGIKALGALLQPMAQGITSGIDKWIGNLKTDKDTKARNRAAAYMNGEIKGDINKENKRTLEYFDQMKAAKETHDASLGLNDNIAEQETEISQNDETQKSIVFNEGESGIDPAFTGNSSNGTSAGSSETSLALSQSTITNGIQSGADQQRNREKVADATQENTQVPDEVKAETTPKPDGGTGLTTDAKPAVSTEPVQEVPEGAAEETVEDVEANPEEKSVENPEGDLGEDPEVIPETDDYNTFFNEDGTAKKVETKSFNSKNLGEVASGVGKGIDTASALFVDKSKFAKDSFTNSEARQTYNSVADTAMQFGPYGAAVGAGMKALGLINDMFGKSTDKFSADTATLEQVGGAYGGSAAAINEAAEKSNQKYGLFDGKKRRKANREIAEARRQQSVMQDIAKDSSDIQGMQSFASDVGGLAYQYNIDGGYDQKYMRAAKEGGTIDFEVKLTDPLEYYSAGGNIESFKEGGSVNSFGVILSDIMESFKEGGSLKAPEIEVIETDTNQKSVIPEGTLHKNKHHLADVGVDDSELTKKGIPVVDNSGEQQAEIELNEIIFTLEVTKELESRYKEFYEEDTSPSKKDELALEAGKLLWKEILYNTDDRTGLIDTLKKGGAIKAKDGAKTPKKIPFAEWVKDVNKDYLSPYYDLELAYEYLPIEDLERWKHAVNSADPEVYLNYKDPKTGEYTYHLRSVAPYGEDEYIFLKRGTETTNPEVGAETSLYWSGENGLAETHDLVYDQKAGRYFYRKKKAKKWVAPANAVPVLGDINRKIKTQKHELGGVITQESLTEMIRQALLNILTHG